MNNNIDKFLEKNFPANSSQGTKDFLSALIELIELDENIFASDASYNELMEEMDNIINPSILERCSSEYVTAFRQNDFNEDEIKEIYSSLAELIDIVEQDKTMSQNKKNFIIKFWNKILGSFQVAYMRYLNDQNIDLPILLDEGAKVPTYAHATDACADLYAKEDQTLKAHSLSNKIDTGVHIALPVGWKACVAPRSSIGAKTGLRLSNEVGIIDSKQTCCL